MHCPLNDDVTTYLLYACVLLCGACSWIVMFVALCIALNTRRKYGDIMGKYKKKAKKRLRMVWRSFHGVALQMVRAVVLSNSSACFSCHSVDAVPKDDHGRRSVALSCLAVQP